jgi:hypothetical protein
MGSSVYMQSASNMIALFITPQFYVWYTLAYNFHMPARSAAVFLWAFLTGGGMGIYRCYRLESWPSGALAHAVGLLLCNMQPWRGPAMDLFMNTETIASQ